MQAQFSVAGTAQQQGCVVVREDFSMTESILGGSSRMSFGATEASGADSQQHLHADDNGHAGNADVSEAEMAAVLGKCRAANVDSAKVLRVSKARAHCGGAPEAGSTRQEKRRRVDNAHREVPGQGSAILGACGLQAGTGLSSGEGTANIRDVDEG